MPDQNNEQTVANNPQKSLYNHIIDATKGAIRRIVSENESDFQRILKSIEETAQAGYNELYVSMGDYQPSVHRAFIEALRVEGFDVDDACSGFMVIWSIHND